MSEKPNESTEAKVAELRDRGAAELLSDVTVKAHPGVDDATQRDVPLRAGPVSGGMHNANRGVTDQSADVDYPEVEGQQYPVELDVMLPSLEDRDTLEWQREYVLLPGPDKYGLTDPTRDIFTAALAQGYRPCGDVHLVSTVDHPDGLHKIVKYAVDVKPTKSDEQINDVVHEIGRRRKGEPRQVVDTPSDSNSSPGLQRSPDRQAEQNYPEK